MTLPWQLIKSSSCVVVFFLLLFCAGVIATMPFSKGDVICDYHGKLISESEGKEKMEDMQEGTMCYLFFIKGRLGTKMCADSSDLPPRGSPWHGHFQ